MPLPQTRMPTSDSPVGDAPCYVERIVGVVDGLVCRRAEVAVREVSGVELLSDARLERDAGMIGTQGHSHDRILLDAEYWRVSHASARRRGGVDLAWYSQHRLSDVISVRSSRHG